MRWPWQWFRHDLPPVQAGTEAARAVREQEVKLRAASRQLSEVQRQVDEFAAAVQAALARRQHR